MDVVRNFLTFDDEKPERGVAACCCLCSESHYGTDSL